VIAYTVTGGLRADVLTDLVQGLALMLGLGVLLAVLVSHAGGPGAAWALAAAPRAAPGPPAGVLDSLETWLVPIVGSVTAQELAARVLACRTPGVARRSSLFASGLYLGVGLVPVGVGLLGARLLPGLADAEQILPALARQHLHAAGYVLLLGALVSAILSTVDSNLLSASSLVTHNLVLRAWPGASERAKLRLARAGVVVAGATACLLAFSREGVYDLVEEASAFGGAGLAVAMAFGLGSRFGGRGAALAAMLAGIAVQVGGTYVWHVPHPFTASLAASVAAYALAGVAGRLRPGSARTPPSRPAGRIP
jgi:Na+/proline symporter